MEFDLLDRQTNDHGSQKNKYRFELVSEKHVNQRTPGFGVPPPKQEELGLSIGTQRKLIFARMAGRGNDWQIFDCGN